MTAKDYLSYIVNEIHSTIVATVDNKGLPVTCAIDMKAAASGLIYLQSLSKERALSLEVMKRRDRKPAII